MPESLFWCFLVNFGKFAKTPFFVEQHRATAPDYSSINSSKGSIGKTVNYETKTKAYVLIWTGSVIYQKGQSSWKNKLQKQPFADFKLGLLKKFCKFHRNTFVLESLVNKAAGLKICNSIKKRLQHMCFPRFSKFLMTPFLQKSFRSWFWH